LIGPRKTGGGKRKEKTTKPERAYGLKGIWFRTSLKDLVLNNIVKNSEIIILLCRAEGTGEPEK
jgi:hypothetical protein